MKFNSAHARRNPKCNSFFRLSQDGSDFNNESENDQDRSEGDSAEAEYIRVENMRVGGAATSHQHEAKENYSDADNHQHIIFSAESEVSRWLVVLFLCCHNFSKIDNFCFHTQKSAHGKKCA